MTPSTLPKTPVLDPLSITSTDLQGGSAFNLTPAAPAIATDGALGAIQAHTDAFTQSLLETAKRREQQSNDSFKAYFDAALNSPGKASLTNDLYSQSVDPAEAALRDANQELVAEQNALNQTIAGLKENKQGYFGTGLDQAIQKAKDESLARQANISVKQMAAQGRYDSARATADRVIAARLEQSQRITDALRENYENNKSLFSDAESRAFQSMLADRQNAANTQAYAEKAYYDQLIRQNDPKYRAELTQLNYQNSFLGGGAGGASDPVSAASAAILGNESNGSYTSLSPVLKGGSYAGQRSYGKYQVLESNIPSWTKQFYGQSLTPTEFLNNPAAQEAVQRGKIEELWSKYGNIQDVASVYFTGVPYARAVAENRRDQATGMTVQQYVAQAAQRFGQSVSSSSGGNSAVDNYAAAIRTGTATIKDVPDYMQPAVLAAVNAAPKTNALQDAQAETGIQDIDVLLSDPALSSVVGPNSLSRAPQSFLGAVGKAIITGGTSIYKDRGALTGANQNFLGSVEQLGKQLTIDNLTKAKANGATFGALSDTELALLAQSATKINSWAIKDKSGNVVGYNIDETNFKKELNRINNFKKLDYILKGGDPSSVDVTQQPDGSYWTKNFDGSFTRLR